MIIIRKLLAILLVSVVFPAMSAAEGHGRVASHELTITVDIENRTVAGTDTLTLRKPVDKGAKDKLKLYVWKDIYVERVEYNGVELEFSAMELAEERANEITVNLAPPQKGASPVEAFTIHYKGVFQDIQRARDNIKRGVAFVEDGAIGEEGVILLSSALWYPQEEVELALFDLTVTAPAEYTPVAEGELLAAEVEEDGRKTTRWRTTTPIDGLTLIAGRYIVTREKHRGVDIYTFFFEDDRALSKLYIDKTKGYLDRYDTSFGPYPYKKFAVVENFLPTGYGMPSFTLLGSSVLRLPFIPDTSLAHEIAHSWWGNSVFMDLEKGNWVEALTTFTADYRLAREEGPDKALEFKTRNLRGYKNYAGSGGIPLEKFIDSETPASRAVGYNKGFYVFNMLERLIGADAFDQGLRDLYEKHRLNKAGWEDLRRSFETAAGENLAWFFDQWTKRSGGPDLSIGDASVSMEGDSHYVSFEILQSGDPYRLIVPVLIKTERGEFRRDVMVGGEKDSFAVELPSKPLFIQIDPDYEVFRILSDKEMSPTLGGCFGDKSGVIVMPNRRKAQEKYFKVADAINTDFGLEMTTDAEIGRKDYLAGRNVFILGGPEENLLAAMVLPSVSRRVAMEKRSYTIGGERFDRINTVLVAAVKNPHDPARTICFFMGGADPDLIQNAGRRIKYFSQKSYLVFDSRPKPVQGLFEGENPLKRDLSGK